MRRQAHPTEACSLGEAGFVQGDSSEARSARQSITEKARETTWRLESTARRVGGEDGELRNDENGVLSAVDELLAKRVRAEGALGGAVVAVKMDERGDAFFGPEAIPLGDEDDHGVIAVANPGEGRLGEPEHERRAERIASERLEPSPYLHGLGPRKGSHRDERERRERSQNRTAVHRASRHAAAGERGPTSRQ